jgi:molecular chaperone DnaK (HSP70)
LSIYKYIYRERKTIRKAVYNYIELVYNMASNATAAALEALKTVGKPRVILGVDLGTNKLTVSKVCLDEGVTKENAELNAYVLTSDTGMKSIPPLVGFRGKARKIGEPAGLEERSNAKNTFCDISYYLGKAGKELQGSTSAELYRQFQVDEGKDGSEDLKFTVAEYNGDALALTGTQLAAMLVGATTKFLPDSERENLVGVSLATPNAYTEVQTQSLCDALRILKLDVLPPVSATAAIEAEYLGKHKERIEQFLNEGEALYNVLFIDIGHTATNVSAVQYTMASPVEESPENTSEKEDTSKEPEKTLSATVKATDGSAALGARDVDHAIFEDVLGTLKDKHKVTTIAPNNKYGARVIRDCRKAKEILSTITETALILENLPGEIDARIPFSQTKLEACCSKINERIRALVQGLLGSAGLTTDSINAVELSGGGVRIPFIRKTIEGMFGGSSCAFQTTLPPEVVSKGAALLGASHVLSAGEDAEGAGVPLPRMSEADLGDAIKAEEQMQAQDAELRELGKARDELESYIYEMRRVLSGSPHMSLLDSDTLSPLLTAAEDWMYETPDEYTRESYTEKRSELEKTFQATSPQYFKAVEEDRKKVEAELVAAEKVGDAERAAERELNGEPDHDRRKLKKEDRMRLVTRNKDEGTELFKGKVYKQAAIRYTKALQNCAKFFDLGPEDQKEVNEVKVKLHGNLALCFLKMKEYRKAINNCSDGISVDKTNSKLYFRRATAYYAQKKISEAVKDVKEALKLSPDDKAIKKLKLQLDHVIKKQKAKEKKMAMKMFG